MIQKHFANGQKGDFVDPSDSALGFNVKPANAFDLVTKEIKSHRLFHTRRKDINNIAANRVITGLHNLFGTVIAHPIKIAGQIGARMLLS